MSKQIPLTKGAFTLVDDDDFEWLSKHNWQLSSHGYAKTGVKGYYMHRAILGAPPGREVDHINRDKLDNRRENLRIITNAKNNRSTPQRKDNTSGFKGVSYFKPRKCWVARIQVDGKRYYLGNYKTKEEAIMAYNRGLMEYNY